MARFKLYLLGSFYATLDGELLTEFRSDKARALLAYLPLEAGEPIRRNLLKALLWDGYDSKSASLSLRVALSNLSKMLKPLDLLTVTRQTVQFNVSSDEFWCDVIEFLTLYQRKPLTCPLLQEVKSLHPQGMIYRGEFLSPF